MPTHKKNTYLLIDGNALIHRGFHALPELRSKAGDPVGAIYGFCLILLRAIADLKPTHIACTFDLPGPTFRHERYAGYKATRTKQPDELYAQFPRVKEAVRALGIPVFELAGFEADDLLGTLSKSICEHEKNHCAVYIATGDLDSLQLVDGCVKIYTARKGISDTAIYDEKAIRDRYGLTPLQMLDYKSLRGDPSDNIPGVKGIGEKTAQELISNYGSLAGVYEALANPKKSADIKPRVRELLENQKDMADESYLLSKIVRDVPGDYAIAPYNFGPEQQQVTVALFQELGFRSLLNKLPKSDGAAALTTDDTDESVAPANPAFVQNYQLVQSSSELSALLLALSTVTELCIDTETTSLDPIASSLVGVGFCFEAGSAYYVPAAVLKESPELQEVLASGKVKKIGHNIKYDIRALGSAGLAVGNVWFDTMIASYVLNSETRAHGLDAVSFSELGYRMQPITDLIGTGKNQITMDEVPVEKVSWYCGEDVDMTFRLKDVFEPKIQAETLERVFYEIDMPLIPVTANMEDAGILLDVKLLNQLSAEAEISINELVSQIHKLSGVEFNVASPKQMKDVLFDRLKLSSEGNRRTKTGLSTAAGELEKMIDLHPVIAKILEYRELAKLQSTYLEALPDMVSKQTGRIHTNYNQTIAATGRLSSTEPNLHNIPVRGEGLGSKVRQAFVAKPGYELLSMDYSQIELRIAAHVSKDEKMLQVFTAGEDIHTKTAVEVFGVKPDEVTKDMRRDAKAVNFGVLYGLSSYGLQGQVQNMSRAEAGDFINRYFAAYPKVEQFLDQVKLQVREEGFVRSETGRIRRFPEINSSQFAIRAAAERAAINFPIQSLSADIIKIAMVNIFKEIGGSHPDIRMLLQVHDELVFEVKEGQVEVWAKKLKPLMENAYPLAVPVVVEAKAGKNWGEMKQLVDR